MLCPNCGASVGDSATLCETCKELAQKKSEQTEETIEASSADSAPTPPGRIPTNRSGDQRITMILAGSITALLLLLALVILRSSSAPAIPLTPQQQAELDSLHSRCVAVFEGALKMQKDAAKQAGGNMGSFASAYNSMVSMSGSLDKQCQKMRQYCEQNYTGTHCQQQRRVTAVFFVMQQICHKNGVNSMSSADCQEFYKICVGGNIQSTQCEAILKQHGI